MIIDIAHKRIHNQYLSIEKAIVRLNEVKKYPGQYSALNIVYSSWDWEEDVTEKFEAVYDNIIFEWSKYGA